MFNKRLGRALFFLGVPIRQVMLYWEHVHYYVVCGLRLTSISTDWILC